MHRFRLKLMPEQNLHILITTKLIIGIVCCHSKTYITMLLNKKTFYSWAISRQKQFS